MSVVLPEPFGPSRPTILPRCKAQIDAAQRPAPLQSSGTAGAFYQFFIHHSFPFPPAPYPRPRRGNSPSAPISLKKFSVHSTASRRRISSSAPAFSVTVRPSVRFVVTSPSVSSCVIARCIVFGLTPASAASSRTAGKRDPSGYAPVMIRRASCSVSCCQIGRRALNRKIHASPPRLYCCINRLVHYYTHTVLSSPFLIFPVDSARGMW